ncbi:DUF4142 domain-containing protein [Pontibacter sp. MBLB2868]|uniref:DUF4142 domain-containing protein n=1 Tax=Pontibacter sp. MBLB2868 TaxID=3451555 RepID=UPI003F752F21
MKNIVIATMCVFLFLSLSACDSGTKEQVNDNENGVPTVAGVDSTLTQERQEFFVTAARNIMLQKELAQRAMEKSETRNAKAYGQDLMNWVTTKQNELQSLSKRYGVVLPQRLEDDQLEYIEEVKEEDKQNYKYDLNLWDQIKDSQKDAIDDFDDALKNVEQADASAFTLWARNTQKELRAHMEQAAAYELELKNRDGGIAKPIIEEANN